MDAVDLSVVAIALAAFAVGLNLGWKAGAGSMRDMILAKLKTVDREAWRTTIRELWEER